MKKQELIHLNGLMEEVADYLEQNDVGSPDLETSGVRSTAIHASKTDHRNAVFYKANVITDYIKKQEDACEEPLADGGTSDIVDDVGEPDYDNWGDEQY